MKSTFHSLIRKIIDELNLGSISENVQKTLELRIGEIVDEQIESALVNTLTPEDWEVYAQYRQDHPQATHDEALEALIAQRKELQEAITESVFRGLQDVEVAAEVAKKALSASAQAQDA